MIKKCDNLEYFKWIEMSEPIFENMNIDISKIHFYMDIISNNNLLPDSSGRVSQIIAIDNSGRVIRNGFMIQICTDLQFDEFIQTYSHEVGHATQKWGYFENPKEAYIGKVNGHANFGVFVPNLIGGVIAESIALKFEKTFLKKFNKKYDTNIAINSVFKKSKNIIANQLKNLTILITKSEYNLKK